MPEREKPFSRESGEVNLPEKKPDRGKEVYESREEKPTLPVLREGTGLSSVDARQAKEKKAARLEQFNRLVGELREALGSWNLAQTQLIHQQRELQRILDKPLLEWIQDFLLGLLHGPDTKAEDAAQLAVNNARELSQVRLERVRQLFAVVRAMQEQVKREGGEVDDEIKRFLEELRFIDSVKIEP